MNKNIKLYTMPIAMLLVITFAMTLVSAAATMVTPTAGNNYSSAITFRVTYVNGTDVVIHNNTGIQGMNSSLWYNLTSGGAGWLQINISGLGYSDNGSDVTFSLPISTIADGTYRFNVTLGNNSQIQLVSTAVTTPVIIDDTAPSITMGVSPIAITPGRVVNYYYSLSDATSGISKAICTATDPNSKITSLGTSTTTTLTAGSSTAPKSFIDSRDKGTYKFNCSVTDTAGNSAFTQKNVTASIEGSYLPYVVNDLNNQQQDQKKSSNIVFVLIILAVIAYLLLKDK